MYCVRHGDTGSRKRDPVLTRKASQPNCQLSSVAAINQGSTPHGAEQRKENASQIMRKRFPILFKVIVECAVQLAERSLRRFLQGKAMNALPSHIRHARKG